MKTREKKKKVFLVDDDELIIMTLSRQLMKEGYEILSQTTTEKLMENLKSGFPDVILLDINLPDRNGIDILRDIRDSGLPAKVIMLTADDTAETAVRAMKLGAADYLTKPFNIDEVKIVLANVIGNKQLEQEIDYLRKISSKYLETEFIGNSEPLQEIKLKIAKMADAHVSSVLITGESGTGKEVVAKHIHNLMFGGGGPVREPFVGVNCAALPHQLLESELFGHEKGAFTDAKTEKKGLFELAHGGTILLDEIGEMEQHLQTALLRVLEERTVRRIGGKDDIPIDVTVIATTNRNLDEAVGKGQFRTDLFYRLSTFYIHIPPLRERKEDIIPLARYFLSLFVNRYNKRIIKGFAAETEKVLESYAWPGNVRELRNLIERLVVLENVEEVLPSHLPDWMGKNSDKAKKTEAGRFILPDKGISLEELEKDLIIQALEKSNNNKTNAAKLLEMSYDSFRYQMKKFNLD
ncbi:MAG: sigma-54 dependent transcriptional regulator [Nitrospirota bacterium]|nr:sigma-54 dependent transcriptional regulator [Nitrospirota bacterium]